MRHRTAMSDMGYGILAPDGPEPGDWFAGSIVERTPEQHLALAVLERACLDWAEDVKAGRSVDPQLRAWFASDSELGPFGFRAICAYTGIDAGAVRERLDRLGKPVAQPIPIGELSKRVRAAYGYSMDVLGARIGASQNTIWHWEHGRNTSPTLNLYSRLWRMYMRRPEAVA